MRNTREEIYEAGGGKFGNLGKVVYDNAKKSFAFERNNLKNLAKSWWKNPGFKTAGKTIGYFKANVAEGLQENAQEAIARANEESAREALNSSIVQTSQYSNGVNSFLLKDSVADERTSWAQYSKELGKEFSARGFETFATGFVMGAFAGPLNNAVPFISTQYNRMYNKAEYAKWVQTKTKITEDLVQELNNVDIKDFLNSKMINLGKQDVVSNIKDSQGSSTKEILDSDNESFIQQVKLMNETKSTEVFIDKLKSMQELTDKELLDAIPGDKTNDAGFYRERINKSINKLKTVQEKFDQAQEMFPNPIPAEKLQQLDKSNTYEYNKQVALHMAWEQSVENYVFFSESFEDVTKRMSKIQNSYIEASYGGPDGSINIGQADYGAAKVLFKPEDIGQQKTLLEQEIDIEEQKANKNTTRINALKDQIKSLDAYEKAFLEFRKYNIRGDFKQQARNILQAQKAEGEVVTEEEVDAYLDEELGSADDQVLQGRIFKDLKSAHHNYLKAVAGGVNATMRTSNLDKSFEDLLDYYKLGQEARSMTDAINILHDPSGFLEAVDRNQKWIKRLYDRRSEYYTKLVNDQISLIEDNAFLNQLANQGLYISSEDFVKYKEEGTLPDEIFDNNNKVVYKKGTPQYERIYKELFIPYENLKDLTVKEATLLNDEIFNAKLVDLNKMYDEKINNLPLEPTRVSLQLFEEDEDKRYSFKQLVNELGNDQTLQAVYSETEDPVLFYKDNEGNIRFTDKNGEVVNVNQIDNEFDFISAEIFNIQQLPNQDIVSAINQERVAAIEDLTQEFLENESAEEITIPKADQEITIINTDTPIDEMPAKLRNELFAEFNKTLSVEERDTLTEEQQENLFDKFVKQGNFTVKKIIDDYNQKESEKRDLKVSGDVKKDFEFQFNGKTFNTENQSAPNLRAIQTRIKLRIESLEETKTLTAEQQKTLKYLKVQVKNLEGVITARTREGLTPEQLVAIEKIQELKSKQPKYTVDANGYNIEGKGTPYKRVTSVINQFLGDYTYRDKDKVIEIFDRTLGQDINAIDAFVNEINAAGLAGVEPYTIRELKLRLPKALEKQEATVTPKTETKETTTETSVKDAAVNLVGELTYESSRVTGNYIDQAVKDLFDKGTVPVFNENQISREAYDNLFGSQGYLVELKRRADNGEVYIASTGIVVYDDALGIAGEIDLLVADRKGNITIVDIKTGQASKWKNFFKKNNQYSKLENYGLQQTAYANLLNRMVGVDANIALLPIQVTKSTDENTDGKIETAVKPSAANLLSTEYLIALDKPQFIDRINSVIPVTKVEVVKSTSLSEKGLENESSDDQDNEALNSASGLNEEDLKLNSSEQKEYDTFRKRITDAKTISDLTMISNDISMSVFQGLMPNEALLELSDSLKAQTIVIEGSLIEEGIETTETLKVDEPFMASRQIVQSKGKNKGKVFVEQFSMVKITKIDGNKVTIVNNKGNAMTITLESLNENYRSEESLEQPAKKVTQKNKSFGAETVTSASELLSDQNKLDELNKSDDTLKKADDDLLNDLEC